uniref:H15 domain-containing protein n=1 Tax=Steinernema glaseri TaxID=37863 RepID=A0A1I7YCA0_9BILA
MDYLDQRTFNRCFGSMLNYTELKMSTEQQASEATTSVEGPKARRQAAVKAAEANAPVKKSAKKESVKAPKARKADKKVANHPGYLDMIVAAISGLQEKKGSSKKAIVNYILAHYDVGDDKTWLSKKVKLAMKRGLETNKLQQATGIGATGRVRLPVKESAKATKPKVKKPVKKAPASPKAPKKVIPAAKKAVVKAKKPAPAPTPAPAPKKTAAKPKPVEKKTKAVKKGAKKAAAKPKSA